jgi:hypothetical protein
MRLEDTQGGKATNFIIMYLLSVYTMSPRKSWQTDNKRTELPITTIPTGVVILKSSREHMFEEQARYMPSCAR